MRFGSGWEGWGGRLSPMGLGAPWRRPGCAAARSRRRTPDSWSGPAGSGRSARAAQAACELCAMRPRQIAHGVDRKRQQIEAGHQRRQVLLPVPEVVLQVVAPGLEHVEALVASRPEEFHLRPLTERCGSLSAHTAPTKQPTASLPPRSPPVASWTLTTPAWPNPFALA